MAETKMLNIHQRILEVMKECDYVQKGEKLLNNQYKFVSHDAVVAKLHPLFVKHGITVIPSLESFSQEGNRTMVKILVAFTNVDEPNDKIILAMLGYGVDPSDKGPGKAMSYAFKYALLKTFCLETGDDPDNDQNSVYEPAKCQEFEMEVDSYILDVKTRKKMNEFLKYSSEFMGKQVEDVKREALKNMEKFMQAFNKWEPKKKND
jgi:ERF superfamily